MRLLLAFLVLSFFSACSLIEPAGQDIFTLNEDFELQLFERIEPNIRQLELVVRTVEKQPCENAEIALQSQVLQNGILLRLENILAPDESTCIPRETIITNEIPLSPFTGNMDFIVQIKDIIEHRGLISSDPEAASFFLLDAEGLRISRNELFKIPSRLIWGSVGTEDRDKLPAMDAFFSTLESQCQKAQLKSGYYSYFEVDSSGDIEYLFGNPSQYRRDFAYIYTGDVRNLYTSLDTFRNGELDIIIQASNGLRF